MIDHPEKEQFPMIVSGAELDRTKVAMARLLSKAANKCKVNEAEI